MKIIAFNGPAYCGKDHAVRTLLPRLPLDETEAIHLKFTAPLKYMLTSFTGLSAQELEHRKDQILPEYGMTPRDMQTAFGDTLRQSFGPAVLGNMLKNTINRLGVDTVFISDLGLAKELHPLIQEFGGQNILVAQIARRGCVFIGDIREYVSDNRVKTEMILNDGTTRFEDDVFTTVINFLGNGEM